MLTNNVKVLVNCTTGTVTGFTNASCLPGVPAGLISKLRSILVDGRMYKKPLDINI